MRPVFRWLSVAAAVAVGTYITYVGVAWRRYGRAPRPSPDEEDERLDQFMPSYDVVERHHIPVRAAADTTFAVACDMELMQSPVVRAVFEAREALLRSEPDTVARPRGLLGFTKSIGWGVLAESPGREIVMGAVTQPWQANPVFRPVAPNDFAAFSEPGYVKIAWTLRADPVGANESVFRTETRAVATDPAAREKFRRYWSLLSPGIVVVRLVMLRPLKAEAERRAQGLHTHGGANISAAI
jgi:hypothetical protein